MQTKIASHHTHTQYTHTDTQTHTHMRARAQRERDNRETGKERHTGRQAGRQMDRRMDRERHRRKVNCYRMLGRTVTPYGLSKEVETTTLRLAPLVLIVPMFF